MDWLNGNIPRFYPLIAEHKGVVAWWVCDGDANTEHTLAAPYINKPCISHQEAIELSEVLNEG